MRVNMMLERRMDQLITKLDKMLADLTPSSAKIHEGPGAVAERAYETIGAELMGCALLSRPSPMLLVQRVLDWSWKSAEPLCVGKKFIPSLGSLRAERESRLTFAEAKRTAIAILTLKCLATCLGCLDRARSEGGGEEIVFAIMSYGLGIVGDIAPSQLRREACLDALQIAFRAVARFAMAAFVEFVQAKIEATSKSPGYELFVRCLLLVELSIYPAEELEVSLNLVEILASYYGDAAGLGLREAYAQTLLRMLRPLVQPVSAEVNIPKWDRVFCKILLPRAMALCEKQKYRLITLELAVIVLCLCSKDAFLEKWFGLCEAIATMIKDGSLPEHFCASILQLIWVYCTRFAEAFATRTSNISRIQSIFSPLQSRRLAVPSQLYQRFCLGLAIILFPIQQSSLLRDIIQPLFDGSESCSHDSFPSARVIVGIKTLLFLGRLGRTAAAIEGIPDWGELKVLAGQSVEELCEGFASFKPDLATQDILLRVKASISRTFQVLDMLIWDESVYAPKYTIAAAAAATLPSHSRLQSGTGPVTQETDTLRCLTLLIKVSPHLGLPLPSLVYFEILLKYCTHPHQALAQAAVMALERHLFEADPDVLEVEKVYWVFSSRFDRVPDRCQRALLILSELFVLIVELLLTTTDVESIRTGEAKPLLADIAVKQLMLLLSADPEACRNAQIAGQVIGDWVQENGEAAGCELLEEAQKMTQIFGQAPQNGPLARAKALEEMAMQCPAIVGLSRPSLLGRMQDLQATITGKTCGLEDLLVEQWSHYLAALLAFGPPDADGSCAALNRRVDGISLRRLLSSFARPHTNVNSTRGFLKMVLGATVASDNECLCRRLCDSATALAPSLIDDFFQALDPHIAAVSEDYRNVKYQVLRKNRRQDLLKITVTRLLSSVAPKIRQSPQGEEPDYMPHRYLRRYMIEVFYFVTEIDTEGSLYGLRQALAELVQRYHQSLIDLHPRHEFFPFKLQHELFSRFRRWFDELRGGTYPVGEGTATLMSGSIDSFGHLESGISLHSVSLLGPDAEPREAERLYAEAMVSLCYGLVSPLPVHRSESIPTSQVFRWIDSLSACDSWGPPLLQMAINNLLITNQSLAEKVLQKIFSPEIISANPRLSDHFFLAISSALLETRLELPEPTVIALLCFKCIQGGEESRAQALEMAGRLLKQLQARPSLDTGQILRRYVHRANEIASELLQRSEGLLFDPLVGPRLKKHLCRWISTVRLPDGSITSELLQNLAVLSVKSHQAGNLPEFLCLWEALTLRKTHIYFIVEFWLALNLKYRNADSLDVSICIMRHLYHEGHHHLRQLLISAFAEHIEPTRCLLSRDHDHHPVLDTTEGGGGGPSASSLFGQDGERGGPHSRLDPLFQGLDRRGHNLSNFSVGIVLCEWISELMRGGGEDLFQSPEIVHLMAILEYPIPVALQQLLLRDGNEGRVEEDCLVSLEWAIYCPIKKYSLLSWDRLRLLLAGSTASNFAQTLPLIMDYITAVKRHETVPSASAESTVVASTSLADLLASALKCVNMAPVECQDSADTISSIKGLLMETASPQVFAQCTAILKGVTAGIVLDHGLEGEVTPLIRGYTNRSTWGPTGVLLASIMSRLFHGGALAPSVAAERAVGQLLVGLAPCIVVGVVPEAAGEEGKESSLSLEVVEAASMACNLLEGRPETMTIIRILQTIGRRRRGDPLRDIATLFAEALFIPLAALLITTIIAALEGVTTSREMRALVSFATNWVQLVGGKLGGDNIEAWDLLIEALLAKASLGEVASAIDALLMARSTTSPAGFVGKVRPLLVEKTGPEGGSVLVPNTSSGNVRSAFPQCS